MDGVDTATALWWAVAASGVYHGVNPGMGWPLAVSAALMDRAPGALGKAIAALATGHLIAMTAILLPFAALLFLAERQREIQIGAACLVIAVGVWLVLNRRHPRILARVPPSRLALWSFLAAMAHGAGLMLVPIYLGICRTVDSDVGHAAASDLMRGDGGVALMVAALHTGAMTLSGGAVAVAVHRWLGLGFLSRSWFNLDRLWAFSLIAVGAVALMTTF